MKQPLTEGQQVDLITPLCVCVLYSLCTLLYLFLQMRVYVYFAWLSV